MKYSIGYTDYQMALQRSEAVGYMEGCRGDVSIYAFGIIKHYLEDQWALCVQDWQEEELTQNERDSLKEWQYLSDNGWFPPSIFP
jgi:hypothetical protein